MVSNNTPTVFIVLGVYNPNLELFERQLNSLLAQSFTSFHVLLTLDGPQADEVIALATSLQDERIQLLNHANNVGVHENFARGLRAALEESQKEDDLFAFCDQDDVWHQDKLVRQVEFMGKHAECGLCHCDARVVDERGKIVSPSLFAYERRSTRFGLLDLLVMNSVTGMTALATKNIAELASPFPLSGTPEILHDHWLALVAAAASKVMWLEQPLVDYVQHDANQLGAQPSARIGARSSKSVFLGHVYRRRCARQYEWRRAAFIALSNLGEKPGNLRAANITGWSGGPRLLWRMVSAWFSGEARQSAQVWRLLAGKLLGVR